MKSSLKSLIPLCLLLPALFLNNIKLNAQAWTNPNSGLDNNVWGMLTDTANNLTYIAGPFNVAGGNTVNYITQYDGTNFSAMNIGMNNFTSALAIYNNQLYCGGNFTVAGSNSCSRIAVWDGSDWQAVGTGMNGDVYYLHAAPGGNLYAGGVFTTAGGNPASRIAMWDGINWSALGSGVSGGASTQILSIQEFNGEIYVAGQFNDAGGVSVNNIARWDGANWSDVAGGATGASEFVVDLFIYNNELYAAGSFTTMGGVVANGIAKWNGASWSDVGTGFSGGGGYGAVLWMYNGELYVGGNFTSVDGVSANRIARYNGISWNNLTVGCDQEVGALEVLNGELLVGGTFFNGGGTGAQRLAKWTSGCTAATVATGTDVSCFGACDGSASLYYTGVAPFSFLWSNGDTVAAISSLCPGNYTVTVTDNNGCTAIDSVIIIEHPLPLLSVSSTNPVCPAQCNGSAYVTATGFAPFTYSWSTLPVQTTDTATALCAGTYYVTVTDSAGCASVDSVFLIDPIVATISFFSTTPQCFGACTGSITANVSGNSPLSYLWSTGDTTLILTNLCEGWYVLTVTDSLGCSTVDSTFISQPTPVDIIVIQVTDVTCNGFCDGFISITTGGGIPGYIYLWSNNETTSDLFNVCAGTYTVTATDVNGCQDSMTIVVNEPAALSLTMIPTNATCQGCNDGSIAVTISGGTPPYIYFWTPPVPNPNQLTAGWYYLCITDNNNCQICDSAYVDEPNGILGTTVYNNLFLVYPNPFSTSATLKIPRELIKSGKINIEIYDLVGNKVSNHLYLINDRNDIEIKRNTLSTGMYLFRIYDENTSIGSGKFIIE